MEVNIRPHKLLFKFPFKLAHTERDHTLGAYLELIDGVFQGKGEIVFPPYYPETLESFTKFIEQAEIPDSLKGFSLREYLNKFGKVGGIDGTSEGNNFALAALDIALHNLVAACSGEVTISEMYNISGDSKPTSFTLGISSNEEMKTKLADAADFKYIKLKVDQDNIARITTNFQKLSDKAFVVDANQGFTSKKIALEWCFKLNNMGVAYLEQPFHKDDLSAHKWLTERSPIPIIADESFQTIHDINLIKDSFSGLNIKLMKCGGILPAFNCFQQAKKYNLLTVIGCMSESSVAVDAAAHLAPLANWVDLDGPFLLKGIESI